MVVIQFCSFIKNSQNYGLDFLDICPSTEAVNVIEIRRETMRGNNINELDTGKYPSGVLAMSIHMALLPIS